MSVLVTRLASVVAVLALGAGNLAACTGWESTPEARMACCATDPDCPLHDATSPDSGVTVVSQSQADSCCAVSEGRDSSLPTPAFVPSATLAVASGLLPAVVPAPASRPSAWLMLAPLPRSAVPTHVLLSVFLI